MICRVTLPRGLRGVLVCLASLLLLTATPAQAAKVGLRVGEHPGYARLVFDWPRAVNYNARLKDGYLQVSFARSADFDLSVLRKRLKRYIADAQVSGDGRSVVFSVKGSYGLKHFTLGPKVVVDLLHRRNGATAAKDVGVAPGQKPDAPLPRVTVRGAEDERFSRLVFDWPMPVSVQVEQRRGGARLVFDQAAKLDLSRLSTGKLRQIAALRSRLRGQDLHVEIDLKTGARLRQWKDGLKVVVDVAKSMPATAEAESGKTDAPAAAAKAEKAKPESAKTETAKSERARPEVVKTQKAKSKTSKLPAQVAGRPIDLVPGERWQGARAGTPATPPAAADPAERAELRSAEVSESADAEKAPLDAMSALEPAAGDATQDAEAATEEPEQAEASEAKAPAEAAEASEAEDPSEDRQEATASASPTDAMPKSGEPSSKADETEAADGATAAGDEKAEGDQPSGETADKKAAEDEKPELVAAVGSEQDNSKADEVAEQTAEAVEDSGIEHVAAPLPGHLAPREEPVALRFNWAEPTAAATFRRGNFVWLVFDRRTEAGLEQKIAAVAPELSPVVLKSTSGTVVRLNAAHRLSPRLIADGTAWVLDLRVRDTKVENPLTVVLDSKSVRPRAMVPLREPGRLQSFIDPALGDLIYVAPVRLADQGLASSHDFPEFKVLPTRQGIVVRSKSDTLSVSVVGSTLVITSPQGLMLSSSRHRETAEASVEQATPGQRLFDLVSWREGGLREFTPRRQALQRAQSEAKGRELSLSRLKLARFYFGHGLAAEAAGVLAVLAEEDPRLGRDPQVVLMRGASQVLNEQFAEAHKTLSDPLLSAEPEATLWRAVLAALSRDWAYAADAFDRVESLISDYVPLIRHRLDLLAAESRIEVGDSVGAAYFLGRIRRDEPGEAVLSDVAYLEGRQLLLEDDPNGAKRNWELVLVKADNRRAVARAKLALIDLTLQLGEITSAQATEELERLHFVWRGDAFEFGLIERKAELYLEMDNFRESLLAYRRAASHLADVGGADRVTERMRQIFRDLFLGDRGKALSPIKLLALYEEFRELTPPGEDGDAVVEGLAAKLADVDLLNEGIALLRRQVTYRLEGAEKARIGAEVARLSLLNEDPQGALDGLDESRVVDELPEALERNRRFMEARAMALTDRFSDALAVIGPDDSRDALALRFMVNWRWRNWAGAAEILEAMLPEDLPVDEPPDAEQNELIVALAVAYSLADDLVGLADLKWRFGPAMALGESKETFEMLTGDLDRGMVTSIADELRGVSQIDSFLNRYRERWQEASLDEAAAQ